MPSHDRSLIVDQEARDLANRAIALIEAHERVCVEQARASTDWREQAGGSLERVERAVGTLSSRIWLAGGGLITAMFAVILALVFKQ